MAVAIVALRAGRGRTLVALVALAHIAILANVALFPIPFDVAVVDAGRAGVDAHLAHGGVNLVPFATISPVLAGHAAPIATRIALLNVFVLTPAAVYLPLLFPALGSWRGAIALTIVGGVSVEAAQLAVSSVLGIRYRSIDIDDVILNAIGILIGWLAVRVALRIGGRAPSQRSVMTTRSSEG